MDFEVIKRLAATGITAEQLVDIIEAYGGNKAAEPTEIKRAPAPVNEPAQGETDTTSENPAAMGQAWPAQFGEIMTKLDNSIAALTEQVGKIQSRNPAFEQPQNSLDLVQEAVGMILGGDYGSNN